MILRMLICLALLASNTLNANVFTRTTGSKTGARVYLNPTTGRFWTLDTYEGNQSDPLSLHKYLYCQGNPVNHVDPTGHDVDVYLEIADIIGTFAASPSSPPIGKVNGQGGPDVALALNRTLLDVEAKFYSWSKSEKRKAAEELYDLTGGRGAWDILPLMSIGMGGVGIMDPVDRKVYRCGTGFWVGTVAVNGQCYYANAVNYALWGKMNRLCYDWMTLLNPYDQDADYFKLSHAIFTVQAWKHFKYKDFGPMESEAEAFTTFGYNGALPTASLPCQSSGAALQRGVLDWCWEPNKPRP